MTRVGSLARHLVLGVAVIVAIFPFYWMVVTSLARPAAVFQFPPRLIPQWQFSNYVQAWEMAPWARFFLNTLFIATTTTALVLFTSFLAGYSFGSLRFRGKAVVFTLTLSILMIPSEVLLIPNYIILKDLHWLNTYQAQIIPWGASVFGIFLLRQFFLSLPVEFYEAAQLDGCTRSAFLRRIALPLARAPMATLALYIFLGSWNSFLWPLIVTQSAAIQPIQVGLASFLNTYGTNWTLLSAAAVYTTFPVMILFLFAQKQFVEGVAQGGIKL